MSQWPVGEQVQNQLRIARFSLSFVEGSPLLTVNAVEELS